MRFRAVLAMTGAVRQAAICGLGVCLGAAPIAVSEPSHAYGAYSEPVYGADFTAFTSANPDAPKGCTLNLSASGAFDTLNPWIVSGRFAGGVFELLYDGLLTNSPDEVSVGYTLIAESVEVSEDGQLAVFRIHPQARFHDDHPILADDVVFTAKTFGDHARPFWRLLLKDAEVTATGEREVTVRFPESADRTAALSFGLMPVLPEHYWQERDFASITMEPPLGSSAYRIEDVDPGRSITFERVRDYWAKDLPAQRGSYNFDRIRYDHYFDETTRFQALLKGDIDRMRVSEDQWQRADRSPAGQNGEIEVLRLDAWWPMGMNGFYFNLQDDRFEDVRVREALSLLVPFEWVNTRLLNGAYGRTESYFENATFAATSPPTQEERAAMRAFETQFPPDAFERVWTPGNLDLPDGVRPALRQALDLLAEAGWEIDPDTRSLQRVSDGQTLNFTVLASSDSQRKLFGAWQQQLERIGVEARMQVVDASAFEERVNSGDFDLAYRFYVPSERPGAEQVRMWGSARLNPASGGNRFGIDNPAIDHFLKQLMAAETEAERAFALRMLDRTLQWGYYVVPSYQDKQWRYAYRSGKLARPDRVPELGDGTKFWWCQQ